MFERVPNGSLALPLDEVLTNLIAMDRDVSKLGRTLPPWHLSRLQNKDVLKL